MSTKSKLLLVVVDESDMHGDISLAEHIMRLLRKRGVAGASATVGTMGFGRGHRIHHAGLFGISDDRPVTIMAVDGEERLRAAAAELRAFMDDGLVVLLDAEVL